MEGLFEIIIIIVSLFIGLTIAGFFITVDILYYIFCNKRIPKLFRLLSEIVALCITTIIIFFFGSLNQTAGERSNLEFLIVGYIFGAITYFISSYTNRIFSLYIEIVIAIGLIIGCIVNIIFTSSQIINSGLHITIILVSIPTLSLFVIALIQQSKRYKNAYYSQKTDY